MGRREARREALHILYQADVSGQDPLTVLAERDEMEAPVDAFTAALARGVATHVAEIDALVGEHAQGWTVGRLGGLERCILRLACYELRYADDVSDAVAIDEAVEAARALTTPEAARFINGVLGGIARS